MAEPAKKRHMEIKHSIHDMPFFKVNAVINHSMLKKNQDGKTKDKRTIRIPRQFLYKEMISEYYPEPIGLSKITDFNPTVHLILEPDLTMTGETVIPSLDDGNESE